MITSTSNQKIKQIVQWRMKARERDRDGVFLTEGLKMYAEAPADAVLEVYVTKSFLRREEKRLAAQLQRTGYTEVSEEVFAKMSDTRTPQGILAVVRQPRYELSKLFDCRAPLFVVLENLQDPGNLGTIVRTGEGAGITGVIMNDITVDVFNPKVIRSTMGSIYRVPFVRVPDLRETVAEMHARGIRTYAAHLKGNMCYDKAPFREPAAILIGNESKGLTDELAECASSYIKIPMEGKVESLNVAVAASLLMYEAHRQRASS